MATNKQAIIRYQTLDKCFRNPGRKYFMEDLINECNKSLIEFYGDENTGVKRRQIYDDITYMESEKGWSIPLKKFKDGRKVYYRYEDLSFSINQQPLNEMEEQQLKEALLTLSRFKGMPQFEWMDELVTRLDAGFGLSNTEEKVIEFEQNQYLKGLEYITPLYNAILYHQVLAITYKGFRQDNYTVTHFHPYFLKQYNNRWFIFGKSDGFDNITNMALDRIIEIEDSDKKYIKNTRIDFEEYFEDVIGVSQAEKEPEKVILKVARTLFPYIKTKPLHGSQKVKKEEDEFVIITLELIPNYELEALILSHGEKITVIEPKMLLERIKQRTKESIKNYH